MGELIEFRVPAEPTPAPVEPLWREAAGEELRRERHRSERTLSDVAERAGISVQYLSEVERGLKEPSSEVLEAVAGELGLRLLDLTGRVTRRLARTSQTGPLCLAA
jgi:transcriptional regulator with XRE-family HTH domain